MTNQRKKLGRKCRVTQQTGGGAGPIPLWLLAGRRAKVRVRACPWGGGWWGPGQEEWGVPGGGAKKFPSDFFSPSFWLSNHFFGGGSTGEPSLLPRGAYPFAHGRVQAAMPSQGFVANTFEPPPYSEKEKLMQTSVFMLSLIFARVQLPSPGPYGAYDSARKSGLNPRGFNRVLGL